MNSVTFKVWIVVVVVIVHCVLIPTCVGQSGDGETDPFILDNKEEVEGRKEGFDEQNSVMGQGRLIVEEEEEEEEEDESFVTEISSLDIYIAEDVNGVVHENSSVTFVVLNPHPDNSSSSDTTDSEYESTDAEVENVITKSFINRSTMGPIILVVILSALIIFGCCAWRIIVLRKKRNRSHTLRNHVLNRQLSESEKGGKEMIDIRRPQQNLQSVPRHSPDEIQPLSEKEIREEAQTGAQWSLPFQSAPLPVTFSTFQTVATVSRLSPPPSYEESYHASKENVIRDDLLSDLGPSYR